MLPCKKDLILTSKIWSATLCRKLGSPNAVLWVVPANVTYSPRKTFASQTFHWSSKSKSVFDEKYRDVRSQFGVCRPTVWSYVCSRVDVIQFHLLSWKNIKTFLSLYSIVFRILFSGRLRGNWFLGDTSHRAQSSAEVNAAKALQKVGVICSHKT